MEPSHFTPHSKFFWIKQTLVRERTLVALLVLSLFLVALHVQAPVVFQILLGAWMAYASIHLIWRTVRAIRLSSNMHLEPGPASDPAERDLVTGLPNFESVESELSIHVRSASSLVGAKIGILLVSIDRLRNISESLGRTTSDEVLRKTARILLEEMRPGNFCARWSSAEFIALFPEITESRLHSLAEKLRSRIQAEFQATKQGSTASIGIAFGDKETIHELIQQADRALENARQSGGNRVEGAASKRVDSSR
ncbi:MAG: GGDEF domain-containing protein [Fibrobacteres bacterium]|nr:GGDEF domain-containing protein [Fibrobacterota bacterium]